MNVLFVCTGNTCRSPLAEAILRNIVDEQEYVIQSAGIAAMEGQAASENTLAVLAEKGISLNHSTKMVSHQLIDWADLILTMTYSHKLYLISQFSEQSHKIFTLKEYVTEESELETDKLLDWDIVDPFGGDLNTYRACSEELETNIYKLKNKLDKTS